MRRWRCFPEITFFKHEPYFRFSHQRKWAAGHQILKWDIHPPLTSGSVHLSPLWKSLICFSLRVLWCVLCGPIAIIIPTSPHSFCHPVLALPDMCYLKSDTNDLKSRHIFLKHNSKHCICLMPTLVVLQSHFIFKGLLCLLLLGENPQTIQEETAWSLDSMMTSVQGSVGRTGSKFTQETNSKTNYK